MKEDNVPRLYKEQTHLEANLESQAEKWACLTAYISGFKAHF